MYLCPSLEENKLKVLNMQINISGDIKDNCDF